MTVLTLVDKIYEGLNNGDYVTGVFLDFSKAFDIVDHDILLTKFDKTWHSWTGSEIICQIDFNVLLMNLWGS